VPAWYNILNSTYSRLKPQLLLALTLEVEEVRNSRPKKRLDADKTPPVNLALTLHTSGGFYQLGPASVGLQEMFTLSLTLQNARQLPSVSEWGRGE